MDLRSRDCRGPIGTPETNPASGYPSTSSPSGKTRLSSTPPGTWSCGDTFEYRAPEKFSVSFLKRNSRNHGGSLSCILGLFTLVLITKFPLRYRPLFRGRVSCSR